MSVLQPGQQLGPYTLGPLIGRGGMGEVYRERDPRLGRDIAIKILPLEVAGDPERLRRFEQEAHAAAALNHPNIVTIHSVEKERLRPARSASLRPFDGAQGRPEPAVEGRDAEREASGGGVPASNEEVDIHFLTMELVEGRPLTDLIARDGLPLDRLLDIAVQLADAVSAAPARGIVHRDLKPANVMVTPEGRVKVLDFGLAKPNPTPALSDLTTRSEHALTGEGHVVQARPRDLAGRQFLRERRLQSPGTRYTCEAFQPPMGKRRSRPPAE
jgi:serine/threonine protein kinase